MKTCTLCKQQKPLSEFNKAAKNKDGLNYRCKDCNSERKKKYYRTNIETIKVNIYKPSLAAPDSYIISLMVKAAKHLSKAKRQLYREELRNNPEKVEVYRQTLLEKRKLKA